VTGVALLVDTDAEGEGEEEEEEEEEEPDLIQTTCSPCNRTAE